MSVVQISAKVVINTVLRGKPVKAKMTCSTAQNRSSQVPNTVTQCHTKHSIHILLLGSCTRLTIHIANRFVNELLAWPIIGSFKIMNQKLCGIQDCVSHAKTVICLT